MNEEKKYKQTQFVFHFHFLFEFYTLFNLMLHFDGMHTNGVSIFRLWVLSDVWCCIWKVCFTAYQKVMPYTRRHVNVYAVREKAIELAENKQIFRLVIDDSTPYNKHGFINKLFNSDFFLCVLGFLLELLYATFLETTQFRSFIRCLCLIFLLFSTLYPSGCLLVFLWHTK